jgi:hypothetical protein
LNERKQSEPTVERSRHGSVREIAALIFGYGPATVQPEAKRVPKEKAFERKEAK